MQQLITGSIADDKPIPNASQQVADILLRLRNQFLERQISALTQRAGQTELSDDERLELLHQQQALRSLKRQPLAPLNQGSEEPF